MSDTPADQPSVTATAPPGGSATAVSQPAMTTTKTSEYTQPSDLPETQWLFRRLFVFGLTAALCLHVYLLSRSITDLSSLREIIFHDHLLIAALLFLYIAGASTEAVIKLVGAIRTARKETITSEPSTP